MASQSLASRINMFKDRMMAMAKGKHAGYDELDTGPGGLEAPLVSQQSVDGDTTIGGPQRGGYAPPVAGYMGPTPGAADVPPVTLASTVPNQSMELMELTHLAKEAASILWEMVALGEKGAAMDEMLIRAEQLQGQLRGLIGDVPEAEEQTLAEAFQAFDMLSRCLSEQENPAAAPEAEAAAAAEQQSAAVPIAPAPETERPLIDL